MAEKAVLIDTSKCTGCRGCQVACKQWWELPAVSTRNMGTYENPSELSAETWTTVRFNEIGSNGTVKWLFRKQQCMHCTNAACVQVCPTYARTYDPAGFVAIDQERCIGCMRCAAYCPFNVPGMGSHDVTDRITVEIATPRVVAYNCAFCEDRIADGLTPACAKTCPSDAIQFGERDELVETGRARVNELESNHPQAYLYGENELGGLHVMYVLTEEVDLYGLPKDPKLGTYPEFPKTALPAWYVEAVATGKFPEVPLELPGEPALPPTGDSLEGTFRYLGSIGAVLIGVCLAFRWFTGRKARIEQEQAMSRDASK